MAAQKKTIIKRALLGVMGDSRSEGVYILVVIEYRNGNRSQMRGLPGEGFLHLKPADVQLRLFHQPREHRGVRVLQRVSGRVLRQRGEFEGGGARAEVAEGVGREA